MYKLLIVDDEHYITDGLYRTFSSLSEFSLEIYRAYCAKQALDYFTRYRMDIIITDINMPIMNGLEMIAEIKTDGRTAEQLFCQVIMTLNMQKQP